MHLFIAFTLASEGPIRKLAALIGHEVASLGKNKVLQIQNLPWSQSLETGKAETGLAGELPSHHSLGTAWHSPLHPGPNPWFPDLCPFGTDGLSLSGTFLPAAGEKKKHSHLHHSLGACPFQSFLDWASFMGAKSCIPQTQRHHFILRPARDYKNK